MTTSSLLLDGIWKAARLPLWPAQREEHDEQHDVDDAAGERR